MNYMWFWLIAFVVLLVCELITSSLISIWFCGGALAALLANISGLNFLIQLSIFIVVSAVLLFLTRPIARKVLKKEPLKTNIQRFLTVCILLTQFIISRTQQHEIL